MAVYVIDASVVMHYLIADTFSENAAAFFRRAALTDQLIVPEFLLMECTNVIWKQVRFHGLEQRHAYDLLRDLNHLPLKRVSVKRVLPSALRIGIAHRLAIYDSTYVALALRMRSPLVSADDAQSRVAGEERVKLIPLASLK